MKKLVLLMCMSVATMSFAARIGVLKGPNASCSETVVIDMDVEDKNNDTKIMEGDKNPPGISLGGHAVFTYCVVNVDKAPQVGFDYAVLRLSDRCPSNAYAVTRRHDNENSRNANSSKGNIYPNNVHVDGDAVLEYCFVPKVSKPTMKYPFKNTGYGVFANPSSKTNMAYSKIKIDDEDDRNVTEVVGRKCEEVPKQVCYNEGWKTKCEIVGVKTECKDVTYKHNSNRWDYNGLSSDMISRVTKIMDDTDNTIYRVVRWTGSSSAILAKAASVGATGMEPAASQVATIKPISAAIKGIDRNAIGLELKSAGDVQISVMGINGAIVAKVTKDNLQPGVYSVNWNSVNIPNGRYVVAVKQNGLISAKNVILK